MGDEVQIFISYAPTKTDEPLLQKLLKHLAPLLHTGKIKVWYTYAPGESREQRSEAYLNAAQIILLLISPDFVASDECQSIVKRAMKRQETEGIYVIPVLLRPIAWQYDPLSRLQALPQNNRFVTDRIWTTQDHAFREIVQELDEFIQKITTQDQPHVGIDVPSAERPATRTRSNGIEASNASSISAKKVGTTLLTCNLHADAITCVAWSPDGKRVVSAGRNGLIFVWEASSGHVLVTYRGHTNGFLSHFTAGAWKALWSPDGTCIASSGTDPRVRLWDARTGRNMCFYPEPAPSFLCETFAIAWSPDGKQMAYACSPQNRDQTIHIWDVETGLTRLRYTSHKTTSILQSFSVMSLAWSPDGQYLASYGSDRAARKRSLNPMVLPGSIQIWEPATGRHIATCDTASRYVNDIVWSPDSTLLASAESDSTVNIWEATTGERRFTYRGHTKAVNAVAWSPDGSTIASAGEDCTVHLWQPFTEAARFFYHGHTKDIRTLSWSPDSKKIASGGLDRTVRIWQA